MRKAQGYASPSLALAKYWGKIPGSEMLAAQTSVAVSLSGLQTQSVLKVKKGKNGKKEAQDRVIVNGQVQDGAKYRYFFEQARRWFTEPCVFHLESFNNFPSAAGLASSSSGFAAAACAIAACTELKPNREQISSLARCGSVSAARAVYGGFVRLGARAHSAEVLYPQGYWQDLRIIVVIVQPEKKLLSSRNAMQLSMHTSPYYPAWVENAESIAGDIVQAITERSLPELGRLMRRSYLCMFATMFSADPPIIYWTAGSLALIRTAELLRKKGVQVWETMDAGPQVKLLCTEEYVEAVCKAVREHYPDSSVRICSIGADAYATV